MKKWSWYTFAFAQFFLTYLNALCLLNYSESSVKTQIFLLTLLMQFYVFLVARREIRVPYLFPKISWWESGLAGMTHIQVEVDGSDQSKAKGQILDLNGRGCFLKCPAEFTIFEKIKIRGEAYGHAFEYPGVVVWNAQSTVTHPKGIGVKFYGLDRKKKKRLRVIEKRFFKEKSKTRVITKAS